MANEIDDGGPAFGHAAYGPSDDFTGAPGISMRDWFAGMALQGLVANHGNITRPICEADAYFAINSYVLADAMIKARKGGV